jgi:hypothetical protein
MVDMRDDGEVADSGEKRHIAITVILSEAKDLFPYEILRFAQDDGTNGHIPALQPL